MNLELKEASVKVPKNTGIEGFMYTLRSILKLSRVQSVNMDDKGTVTYKRYVPEGEEPAIGIDFADLQPWHLIRNAEVEELHIHSRNAAAVLVSLLDTAVTESLYPIAFVVGANSVLWDWYLQTTGTALRTRSVLCALPIYFDKAIPNTALTLCAAYEVDAALIDTKKTFKVEMDMFVSAPTEVDIL